MSSTSASFALRACSGVGAGTTSSRRAGGAPLAAARARAAPAGRRHALRVVAKGTDVVGGVIRGKAYVTKDNIDTDQIIPAEYLTLVPSKPDEYIKLGSYAMSGLPDALYPTRYIAPGKNNTEYPIMIGGENFGCGSSREHAPVAMGACGTAAVVAQSYARIFFRNCVSTGELYPYETEARLCDEIKTGDDCTVDLNADKLINHTQGKEYSLKPLGDAGPVIAAGGIFEFARKSGMIKSAVN